MSFAPMVTPWVLVVGAIVLLTVVGVLRARRPHQRLTWGIRAAMVLCAVAILVRPGAGHVAAPERISDLEVLVVVDKTTSMSALDHDGERPRLDGVREDLEEIAEAMPGARFSLVTFGRFTRTELPFSSDTAAFHNIVETMRREDVFDGAGSRVDAPLEEMTKVLTRAEESRPDRKRLVIFISDGENTVEDDAGEEEQSFADLADLVDDGLVLGYGTTQGGRMPIDEERPSGTAIHDPEGSGDALSKVDEDTLVDVAEELGLEYRHRTGPGGLAGWAASVDRSFSDDGGETRAAHELFWAPGLALFGLGLWELWIALRGLVAARRERRAL